jgi:hypothetical protein
MDALYNEALNLIREIREAALTEETHLASAEDCDYFRTLYRTLKKEPEAAIKAEPAPTPKAALAPQPPQKKEKPQPLPPPISIPLPSEKPSMPAPPRVSQNERFEDLRKLFAKISPQLRILDDIPKDDIAKQISERWKTRNQAAKLSLLYHQESEPHRLLLEHLAQALDVAFGGARLIQCNSIENEKQWEAFLSVPELESVIICDSTLWQLPNLLQYYREVPSHSERFLQKTPLFLLPDLSLYLKDPLLKRSLWKALCQKIA